MTYEAHPTDPSTSSAPPVDTSAAPPTAPLAAPIDNQDQDPNHPANTTQPKDVRPGAERDNIEGAVYSGDNLKTEQEKDASGESKGVGPLTKAEGFKAAETIEDLGIGPRTPYPTGDPAPPSEGATFGQGIKGVTDKPATKPGSSSGPAGQTPGVADQTAAYQANQPADHPASQPEPQPAPVPDTHSASEPQPAPVPDTHSASEPQPTSTPEPQPTSTPEPQPTPTPEPQPASQP